MIGHVSEDVAVSVLNGLASLDARGSMVAEKGARPGVRIAHQENALLVRAENDIVELERRLMLSLEAGQIGTFQIDLEKEEIIFDPQQGRLLNLAPSIRQLSLCELELDAVKTRPKIFEGADHRCGRPIF